MVTVRWKQYKSRVKPFLYLSFVLLSAFRDFNYHLGEYEAISHPPAQKDMKIPNSMHWNNGKWKKKMDLYYLI